MNKTVDNIKTLAGIITYNPDIKRLEENVSAIYPQVDKVIIFDNGSENIEEIKALSTKFSTMDFLLSKTNQGIAKGLSEIMNYAISNKYDWVLSLDDDSVAYSSMVQEYLKYINLPNIATMTSFVEDRNYPVDRDEINSDITYVDRCITSGCFMSVEAYKNSDGYSIDFFIDRVDDDICYNLTRNGYKHIRINKVLMLHEMGFGQIRHFLWHKARAVNYSPIRRYYIFRNETIVRNKYPELIKKEWLESGRPMWINFCLSSLKILLYEKNKLEKISSSWLGWKDGRKYVKDNLRRR